MRRTQHRPTRFGILDTVFAPVAALLWNLLLAYVVYFIARVAYLCVNIDQFQDSLQPMHLLRLFRGGLVFDTPAIIYTNALYIVLMLFPLHLKERVGYHRFCKWLFVIVNALALVINLCDSAYFPYTLRRTTTSVFREFSNENNLGGIFFTELLHHWYLVILFIVVVWALWKLYATPRILSRYFKQRAQQWVYAGVMLVALIIAVPLCIGGCRGGLGHGIRPITINNANQYVDRPTECAIVLNTPFALIRTIGKSVFTVPSWYSSLEEAEKVFSPVHQFSPKTLETPTASELTDTLKKPVTPTSQKKNVVVLIVESFGREYIGALNRSLEGGHYKGYTPCIDSLVGRSLVFQYSFCNGRKSIDGMPSVLCGIPMFVEPFVLTPASMNSYTSVAGLLKDEGYQTAFFHGANRGSMGFMAFANKVGFQEYYGREDYAADSRFGGDADFDGHWGIWDEPFLQYYCAKMSEMKQPFMTAVFTASSHHPFQIPEQYRNVYKEEQLPIHKCIRYTDMALGRFFREASRQPWFRNTIFVLTSDHTNQSNHAEYMSDLGLFCSPIIIFDPSGEQVQPGVSPSVAQQIDIVPTVLGLLGYTKPFLSFGIDLLHTPAEKAFAVNYLNGVYQYVKYGYVLQFDGQQTKAVYRLDDRLMKHNLIGKVKEQAQMERELKALIWQYMYRMENDLLLAQPKTHPQPLPRGGESK